MVHKGEIVEKAVRASGIKITELARQIGVSRRHLYNLFENSNLSFEFIYKIGKIIHYDFSKDFSLYPDSINQDEKKNHINDDPTLYSENINWKNKYLELLEKYNELQMKYIHLLENK